MSNSGKFLPSTPGQGIVSFPQSSSSVYLDALRGVAALLVFADHTRHAFFVEYHELHRYHDALFLPYLMTACGHQAVIVFFVLSGFLVGGSIQRSVKSNRWSWKRYLTHRLVRLWIVLLPALLLVFFCDSLSIYLHAHHPSYSGTVYRHFLTAGFWQTVSFPVLLVNASFLQTLPLPFFTGSWAPTMHAVPVLGTDGALWSLANEFWYYILFPLAYFAFRKHYRALSRVAMGVAFLVVAGFVGMPIVADFYIWLCGVVLVFVPQPRLNRSARVASTVFYAVILLGCAGMRQFNFALSNYLLTGATTLYMWVLLSVSQKPSQGGVGEAVARRTASFSYTLYLVHMPMLYLLGGFFIHDKRWQPSLGTITGAIAIYLAVLIYAWGVASVTEFHLEAVRSWVENKLDTFIKPKARLTTAQTAASPDTLNIE